MFNYQSKDARPIHVLKEAFGEEIDLEDGDQSRTFILLAEFSLGDRQYAVLEPQSPHKNEERSVLRITFGSEGEPILESILDDDEWENVSEVYDEMTWDPED